MSPDDRTPTSADDLDDLDPDELAVHAVVDGEADADQRRRVARDPALVARVAAMRAVADAVAVPVAAPPDDVLAALRARALDPGGGQTHSEASDGEDEPDSDPVVDDAPPPPPDLAARRARRRRGGLPPLPAVAAAVILLVLIGGGLILTDRGGSDDSATTAADTAAGDDGGDEESADMSGGEAAAADGSDPTAELRGAATLSFATSDQLVEALRTVDPTTLDLSAAGEPIAPEVAEDEDADAPDTTVTESGEAPPASTATSATTTLNPADPRAARCDTVLRSTNPSIGPAQAAALVLVDDIPTLVLSNPVEASGSDGASTLLTTFDAVSCVPGEEAVQR